MTCCPKCGSTTIVGPRYVKDHTTYGYDRLRYSCAVCGYATDTPTKDAKEKDELQVRA